jgi:hypothetical protein
VRASGGSVLLSMPTDFMLPAPRAAPALDDRATVPTADASLAPLAHAMVEAAWQTAGLAPDDAHLDDLVRHAHRSALLPEVRLRALHGDQSYANVYDAERATTSRVYDSQSDHLTLEARVTFRLDRLLFVEQEATVERLREERRHTRMRLTQDVLALILRRRRALEDEARAFPESDDARDARQRIVESEVTLDVLTGGTFTTWMRSHAVPPIRSPPASTEMRLR